MSEDEGQPSQDKDSQTQAFAALNPASLSAEPTPNIMDAVDRALSGEESQAMLRDLAAAADRVRTCEDFVVHVEHRRQSHCVHRIFSCDNETLHDD